MAVNQAAYWQEQEDIWFKRWLESESMRSKLLLSLLDLESKVYEHVHKEHVRDMIQEFVNGVLKEQR